MSPVAVAGGAVLVGKSPPVWRKEKGLTLSLSLPRNTVLSTVLSSATTVIP